ncbi:uncharacterized protein LOC117318858, partial [Pecten maximus]|uniref:uncharacterized protein LOC117318858 n=1 Tax=Pecten maximus TaxID=6579 RepID=UPI0014591AD9
MAEQSSYTSLLNGDNTTKQDLIREYHFAGYTYSDIILILFYQHHVSISCRQLHRILRSLGLRRQHAVTDEVVQAIQQEIQCSGSSLGYRSMTRRLLTRHGIVVARSNVLTLQRELDPDGVRSRQMHRFSRRVYINKGPNYLIHVDGYDKLKRFGFAIH